MITRKDLTKALIQISNVLIAIKLGILLINVLSYMAILQNYRQKPNQNGQWSKSNCFANNSNGPSVNNSVCDKGTSSLNTLSADQFSKLLGLLNENKTEDTNKSNVGGFMLNENPGDWLPSSVLHGSSPYEMLFGFKPSLDHLKVFGCLCFFTVS
uniref:Uncharacterized protein n=1 Tax=Helianthus annuus TaxID=4232 RepID=A0A251THU3_HELAN